MPAPRTRSAIIAAATVALMSSVSMSALAQAQDAPRTIASNGSIMIDGRTFTVTQGAPKGDISPLIRSLGARELGPGAIIFRSDDKLYMVDAAPLVQRSTMAYDPAIERQRPYGLRDECVRPYAMLDQERQRAYGLRDTDIERQRPYGLRDLDVERQRPYGLHDPDIDRRQAYALRDLDVERQRPYGLRDPDIERKGPQGLRDADADRQRPQGLRDLDVDRQRPQGLRDADADRQRPQGLRDADIERQRPQGLRDGEVERQRAYINDPDYAYYRLKKTFDENWNTSDRK